ncbi:hypothetical protein CF67_29013 (plasmid) [Candidatus Photodesmus blepharus]|uniref:ATP-grasp domain-containing protein n=1 Tax=Candidatus Photodesmus blepharonis TaxID=1179155 RepID=A0A084CMD1_9GAMM|nr:hypothetical protein [Candidatus Photodesmus blepharus]KEY90960.1 hypothetical protein CF67_29013 [Candidatus Photodesmus blepharus]
MKVHIFSDFDDYHAVAVHWGLKKLGVQSNIIPGISYKIDSSISFLFPEKKYKIGTKLIEPCDSAWIRRPVPPITHPDTDPLDKKFSNHEYKDAFIGLLHRLESLKLCVNSYSEEEKFENKPFQLGMAVDSKFLVPKTLMTNHPDNARKFIRSLTSECVYKAFKPHVWESKEENTHSKTRTFKITEKDLLDDFVVQSTPLILQEYIDKAFDTRVVVMGKLITAVKIISKNQKDEAPTDWRPALHINFKMDVKEIEVPENIKESIHTFMKHSDLSFTCLDFSVDKFSNWWFLESNANGQFLWIDYENKGMNLLSKFCSFLASGDKGFESFKFDNSITLDKFKKSEEFNLAIKKMKG